MRVGFGEVAAAAGLVPAAIAAARARRHPRMTVQTEQGQITTVLDFLRNRRCEVGVGRQNTAAPDLIFEPIHFEQLYVVVGAAGKNRRALVGYGSQTWPMRLEWVQSPVELETGSPTMGGVSCSGPVRSEGGGDQRIAERSSYGLLESGAVHHHNFLTHRSTTAPNARQ